MALLSLTWFLRHGPEVSLVGMEDNFLWVTLGNLVGGVCVGAAYWLATIGLQTPYPQWEPPRD